ncbi:hypothetical protein HY087_01825 [Candidatus Gottesmanbacteria bacterium]|nr:hypothetical protein [Candidatus Gottesmanbacteria bacterium]
MANGKTVTNTLDEQSLVRLAQALSSFSVAADTLRKRIVTLLPAKHGSDLWWEKEELQADEDLKAGRFQAFSSMEEAIHWLDA